MKKEACELLLRRWHKNGKENETRRGGGPKVSVALANRLAVIGSTGTSEPKPAVGVQPGLAESPV